MSRPAPCTIRFPRALLAALVLLLLVTSPTADARRRRRRPKRSPPKSKRPPPKPLSVTRSPPPKRPPQTLPAKSPPPKPSTSPVSWPGISGTVAAGFAQATYYDTPFGGACGYGRDIPAYITALSESLYRGSAGCGTCYLLQCIESQYLRNACTGKTVVVRATDVCPNAGNPICVNHPHFDLNRAAFAVLGDMRAGVLRLKYTKVACPSSPAIKVKVIGSNNWWLSVAFPDSNEAVVSVQVKTSMGSPAGWYKMKDDWGSTFSGSGGGLFLKGTVSFQITGESGKTVVLDNCLSASDWTRAGLVKTCLGNL